MGVGRIDFSRLANAFPAKTEVDLLRQYLNKDDRYRRKQFTFPDKALGGSYFYHLPAGGTYNWLVYYTALRNGSRLVGFGTGTIIDGDPWVPNNPALWGIIGGFGTPTQVEGTNTTFHTSFDFADPAKEPQIPFCCAFGSYFWDWAYSDALMRSYLGTPNYGLGVMYAKLAGTDEVLPSFEELGLGETLGKGFLRTINENPDTAAKDSFISILGDPTLRFQILAPATNLSGTGGTDVTLTWTAAAEANQYFVYRSLGGLDGTWTKLTQEPHNSTTYTDRGAPSGTKLYQVRALKLIATGSGSYTNLSQGTFTSVN